MNEATKKSIQETLSSMVETCTALRLELSIPTITSAPFVIMSGEGCYVENITDNKVRMTFNIKRAARWGKENATHNAKNLFDGAGDPLNAVGYNSRVRTDLARTEASIADFTEMLKG